MNIPKQVIGNGHEVHTRSLTAPPGPIDGFGAYPGLGGNPYTDFAQGGGFPAPLEGGSGFLGGVPGTQSSSSGGGLLNGLNMNQIKGFVDRMGGIEGIMSTMTKVQKVMASFQQMAPMMKLLFSSFGKGKVSSDFDFEAPRRRSKRRKKTRAGRKGGGKPTSARKRK